MFLMWPLNILYNWAVGIRPEKAGPQFEDKPGTPQIIPMCFVC